MKNLRFIIVGIFLVLVGAICPAFAQGGGVAFIPPITPGDCAKWLVSNILEDSGGPCGGGGSGTVTSVGLALPSSILTVSGSPVTMTGTLTGTLATQTANTVFSGPATGSAAAPTFRALTAADLPAGTGTVTSISGGTGILPSTNPCTTTCTLNTTVTNNAQTGTSYALLATDGGKIVSANNASAQAYSLSAASTGGYGVGYGLDMDCIGAGAVTLTAATSVFDNGLSTLVCNRGQDAFIWSDGTNYHSSLTLPVMAADTLLGNFSATANYPIAGALTSCSTASSALTYNTSTHAFGCNTISGGGSGTVNAGTAGNIAYYATSTTAVSDGGSAQVSVGGIVVTSGTAPTNGIGLETTNVVGLSASSAYRYYCSSSVCTFAVSMAGSTSNSAEIVNGAASATNPTLDPNHSDLKTGVGADTAGDVSLIADNAGTATEMERITGTSDALNAATITLPSVTTDTATLDATLCRASTGGRIFFGSGTLGICLGTSSMRSAKIGIVPVREGLDAILALKPVNYFYKKGFGDNGAREQYGFIADDYAKVLPKLTRFDSKGKPNGVDLLGAVPVLVKAIQEMQREIDGLGAAAVRTIKEEVFGLFLWNILLTFGFGWLAIKRYNK